MMNRSSKKPLAEINIVPYIDVMLVLLIIFMITAPLLTQGVSVKLPQAKAKALKTKSEKPLIVTVSKKGKYYLNVMASPEEAISTDALLTRVAAEEQLAKKMGQQKTVLVKGDKDVAYGKVVTVMALLQKAGVDNLGLMTKMPNEKVNV